MEIIASVSLNFIFFFFQIHLIFFTMLYSFFFFYNALRASSREQMFWVLFLCFNKIQPALPSLLVLFALPQPC